MGDPDAGLLASITESVTRAFYEELDKHLRETPGGVILGPTRVTVKTEDDWLFKSGEYTTIRVSASCEDLPEPPEYRLIGGPADSRIVRTRGERIWLVPVVPPPPTIASYAEDYRKLTMLVAEYERQGDTSAYFYKRTYEQ